MRVRPHESRTVYFVSLGCPKNRVDTEVMLGLVDRAGYAIVDEPDDADVLVVNTCGFIDAAKEESIDTILEMAEYKKESGGRLVVTGCLAQRWAGELATEIPEIDHMLGSADFARIASVLESPPETKTDTRPAGRPDHDPESLSEPRTGASGAGAGPIASAGTQAAGKRTLLPVIDVTPNPSALYDHTSPRILTGPRHSAYVKIAEGCDRPCAFCIIPKLRGPQRSRSIASVVAEVERLAGAGTREINLIAQDLTRYGVDRPDKPTLAALLRQVAQVEGVHWVRLHYTYPSAFTDELIEVIATEPRVAKYIDVPLQHIDDDMLKRMRRGHSARITHELVERLRTRIDGLVLRTTFIVGHPGETEQAFDRLAEFVRQARFERVGAFTYSYEPDTASVTQPDRVEAELAQARRDHLMSIQAEISRDHNQALVGHELEVLVDGVSDESDVLMQGRWYGQAPDIDGSVYLADCDAGPGALVRARVTDSADYDLVARVE